MQDQFLPVFSSRDEKICYGMRGYNEKKAKEKTYESNYRKGKDKLWYGGSGM